MPRISMITACRCTWREFDAAATALAEQLAGVGVGRGDRVAVWHGDSAAIHVLFVAIERCGAVVVGIGARAGTREVAAILDNSKPKIADQRQSAQRRGDAGSRGRRSAIAGSGPGGRVPCG